MKTINNKNPKSIYTYFLVVCFFFVCSFSYTQSAVKRASLSLSVAHPSAISHQRYSVQHSIAHMGIMSTVNQKNVSVTRGFLLPQSTNGQAVGNEQIPDFEWSVYPVPFDTYINIDFDVPVSGDMVIRLHDITGQLIMEQIQLAKQQQRIYINHLAQAEYLLTVAVMGKTLTKSLLHYKKTTNYE